MPKNDSDADRSPERARWYSGRQLEWHRWKDVGAFEYDWTKARLSREHPHYLHSDIGKAGEAGKAREAGKIETLFREAWLERGGMGMK